jgi:hypothetical protein
MNNDFSHRHYLKGKFRYENPCRFLPINGLKRFLGEISVNCEIQEKGGYQPINRGVVG